VKRVYASGSLIDAGHARNLLEAEGIRCLIKNEALGGGLGDIPFLDCAPEVWVLDDARADQARRVLNTALHLSTTLEQHGSWHCAHCGESNEAQFAACFRCGSVDAKAL
jgi:hypothetical protein